MKKIFILLSRCLVCSLVGLTSLIICCHIINQFEVASSFWGYILFFAPFLTTYIVFRKFKAYPLSKNKKEIAEDTKSYQYCGNRQEIVSTVDNQNIESTSKNNPQETDDTRATGIINLIVDIYFRACPLLSSTTIILVYYISCGDYYSGAVTFGEFVGQILLYTGIGLGAILLTLGPGLGLIFGLSYLLYIKLPSWMFKRRK